MRQHYLSLWPSAGSMVRDRVAPEGHFNKMAGALLFLFCALCGAGAVPIFLRYLLKPPESGGLGLDIWILNALRYSLAPIFWLPFFMKEGLKHKTSGADPSDTIYPNHPNPIWIAAMFPAGFSIVNQACWGAVGKYADANIIAFFSKLSFPVTVLFCFILFADERQLTRSPLFRMGAVGCLIGLFLLTGESLLSSNAGGTSLFGILLLLLISVSWGGYSINIRIKMSQFSSVASFWVISFYTTIGLVVLMLLFGDFSEFRPMGLQTWVVVIASSFIGITFWHVMYYRAIRGLGTLVSDGVLMTSPFLTAVGSAFFLGERLSALQSVGGSILAGGGVLLVMAWGRHK
jgi:drug/metabolite transporter (DMT)-like permease